MPEQGTGFGVISQPQLWEVNINLAVAVIEALRSLYAFLCFYTAPYGFIAALSLMAVTTRLQVWAFGRIHI